MTLETLIKEVTEASSKILKTIEDKSKDYSGKQDVFANFKNSAESVGISAEAGMRIRMMDKINRLNNIVGNKQNSVRDESLLDTIDDLIGYLHLLRAFKIEEKEMSVVRMQMKNTSLSSLSDKNQFLNQGISTTYPETTVPFVSQQGNYWNGKHF